MTKINRPLSCEQVKEYVNKLAKGQNDPVTKAEIWAVRGAFKLHRVHGEDRKVTDDQRHSILMYLFGVDSSKALTRGQCSALMRWLKPTDDPSIVSMELAACLNARILELGQMELLFPESATA